MRMGDSVIVDSMHHILLHQFNRWPLEFKHGILLPPFLQVHATVMNTSHRKS